MAEHQGFEWPDGQRCAVSLTYDDALPVHIDMVAPLLTEKGLTATFNLEAHSGLTEDPYVWRDVASQGHELGNHTLFHPCRQDPEKPAGWLAPDYDLCTYTPRRWLDEMRVANCLLRMIDGESDRTFGNTCCNTHIGRGENGVDLADLIIRLFVAGRGACNGRIVQPTSLRYGALGHFDGDGTTFTDLRQRIERAVDLGGWIIFMFHGVGEGTHDLFIETGEHARLIDHLGENSGRIWTSSMVKVASYLKRTGHRATPNKAEAGGASQRG
jgi:sialate O-acetylesterase